MSDSTLKIRFVIKLMSNFINAALSLLTINLTTRALGPESLGQYDFSNQSCSLIITFLSLGAGSSFFNWISREKTDRALAGVLSFGAITICIFFMQALFAGITILTGLQNKFWPGIPTELIFWGVVFSELTFAMQVATFWSDGQAYTVGAEVLKLVIAVVRSGILLILFLEESLNLRGFYSLQAAALGLNLILLVWWLWKKCSFSQALRTWKQHVPDFWRHLRSYGGPLVVYGWIGVAYDYFDSWILQFASGSAEQGYFGFANRLAGIIFLFSSALTPIFTREITSAHHDGNQSRFTNLILKIKIPVAITSFLACFTAVNAEQFSQALGGSNFGAAAMTVGIMSLYPIHQTFGQLIGSIFFATGNTRVYARYGSVNLVLGIVTAFILLAPKSGSLYFPGLQLGSLGLAIKMTLVQFVSTNVLLFISSSFSGVKYSVWLKFQILTVALPLIIASLAQLGAQIAASSYPFSFLNGLGSSSVSYFCIVFGGIIYCIAIAILVLINPSFINLHRGQILSKLRLPKYIGRH
jgi:O-antigen/teichoic acid export membrane protein